MKNKDVAKAVFQFATRKHGNIEIKQIAPKQMGYFLHGNCICTVYYYWVEETYGKSELRPYAFKLDWCQWYTPTTANHMNHILAASGLNCKRVGYASARDNASTVTEYSLGRA